MQARTWKIGSIAGAALLISIVIAAAITSNPTGQTGGIGTTTTWVQVYENHADSTPTGEIKLRGIDFTAGLQYRVTFTFQRDIRPEFVNESYFYIATKDGAPYTDVYNWSKVGVKATLGAKGEVKEYNFTPTKNLDDMIIVVSPYYGAWKIVIDELRSSVA
jgi:hypothetical protein